MAGLTVEGGGGQGKQISNSGTTTRGKEKNVRQPSAVDVEWFKKTRGRSEVDGGCRVVTHQWD